MIWHVLRPLSASDLRQARRLRLVHKLGAGVNTIDVDAATRLGIAVANMPGANAPSVAEGTVLLMLAALRRLPSWTGRPGRAEAGRPIRLSARRCATSAAARSGWSATATSRGVETIVTAMGANVLHTSTRDDGTEAGGRFRHCWPTATSCRCTCR